MNRRSFLKFIGVATVAGLTGLSKDKVIAEPRPVPVPSPIPDLALDIRDIKVPEMVDAYPKGIITTTLEITPEFTPTPEAKELKEMYIEKSPSFEKPFKYENINEVMQELGLDLADLIDPTQERVKTFEKISKYNEILPIFSPEVVKWSDLVSRVCFEYNVEHPDNKVNPNMVLALITMESRGNPEALSPAGARGLMQLTSWVYAEGFFGTYNGTQILDPETNVTVGVAYLGDLIRKGKYLGLEQLESTQYAMMEYNGGQKNASRFFKTAQAIKLNGADSDIFKIDSDEKIIGFLKSFYGNAKDYFMYGTNLVKKETLFYKENFTRFAVVAEIAANLKDKGYSDGQITAMLSESDLFKTASAFAYKAKKEIRARDGAVSYFEFKSILNLITSRELDISSLPLVNKYTDKNTANLMMDVIYS
jgi:hypothetical protein